MLSEGVWMIKRANPKVVKTPDGEELHEYVGEIRNGVCYRSDGKTRNHALEVIIDAVSKGKANFKARRLHCVKVEPYTGDNWGKSEIYPLEDIAHTFKKA